MHARIVLAKELKNYGITVSNSQIKKLVAEGKFPKPFKVSEGGRLNAWSSTDIEEWVKRRIATGRDRRRNGEA